MNSEASRLTTDRFNEQIQKIHEGILETEYISVSKLGGMTLKDIAKMLEDLQN
jgi:hypothetical protein